MKAVIYGTKGELAGAMVSAFGKVGWSVEQVDRTGLTPDELCDAYVFPQAEFLRRPFVHTSNEQIEEIINAGFTTIMKRLRFCLSIPADLDHRVDYCIIGSTSSYVGVADSSVYCAVKHGLLGLIRSLNEEYRETNRRFWLCSMGTMDTAMGRELVDQDARTFLPVDDVAQRIVETITHPSNLFEPEIILRRRHIA